MNLSPGTYYVQSPCPQCHITAEVRVELAPVLTVAEDEATIRIKLSQKAVAHQCGQLRLDDALDDGQRELDFAERAAGEGRD